jgi:hypothetical protein
VRRLSSDPRIGKWILRTLALVLLVLALSGWMLSLNGFAGFAVACVGAAGIELVRWMLFAPFADSVDLDLSSDALVVRKGRREQIIKLATVRSVSYRRMPLMRNPPRFVRVELARGGSGNAIDFLVPVSQELDPLDCVVEELRTRVRVAQDARPGVPQPSGPTAAFAAMTAQGHTP